MRWNNLIAAAAASAVLGLVTVAGCGGGKDGGQEETTAATPAEQASALDAGPRASETLKYDGNLADVGERLFDELTCTACHTLGEADAAPDLTGVLSRRTEAWLIRQITEPEWMAQHDPITRGLVEQWGMEMTDMDASVDDARAILNYLERESR